MPPSVSWLLLLLLTGPYILRNTLFVIYMNTAPESSTNQHPSPQSVDETNNTGEYKADSIATCPDKEYYALLASKRKLLCREERLVLWHNQDCCGRLVSTKILFRHFAHRL